MGKRRPLKGPYPPPGWARRPQLTMCGLEVHKDGGVHKTIDDINRKKMTVFGRHKKFCDVLIKHPSISNQHAAIVHGKSGNMYLIDLDSMHGTKLNDKKLSAEKREVLQNNDIIRFGASTREYRVKLVLGEEDDSEEEEEEKPRKRKRSKEEPSNSSKKAKKSKGESDDVSGKIACRHLLVKHVESRRPSSWKESEITRTKKEAIKVIESFRKKLLNFDGDEIEDEFIKLAEKESDCNSHKRGGDLGKFGKNKMQKAFEDVAFALDIGELSEPVETQSGIHLIYRLSMSN